MSATLTKGLSPVRAVLDNGIVVIAQENQTTPAVAVNATFAAGTVNDPPDLPGVAYLAGKSIDAGTSARSANAIAEILDWRGVSLRVVVFRHTFTLSWVCLAADFSDVLEVVADIIRHPSFSRNEVDRRRPKAVSSVRQDDDNPAVRAGDTAMEMLYGPAHPYGRPVKGTVKTLEGISPPHLAAFHSQHLVPAALRVAIVGCVPSRGAIDVTAELLGDWQSGGPIRTDVPPPPEPSRSVRFIAMPGKPQSDIAYGFTTVRRMDPRYHAYWMMNHVLGQFGLGGRLADNIRERQGMAYYAYSTLDGMHAEGPLLVRAGVDPANVPRAIEAIDSDVRDLGRSGPTPEEFGDTRESLIGSIPRMLETNESTAEFLQMCEQFELGPDYDRRLPSLLDQVTLEQVREAAGDVLRPERAAIAVAGPQTGE